MKLTNILSYITFSEIRKEIVLMLLDGPMSLSDIKSSLDISSSGVIPRLRDLEKIGFVYRKNHHYVLTPTGRIVANDLKALLSNLTVIEKNGKYWKDHSLDSIPESFQQRIGEIGDFFLVESSYEDTIKPQTFMMKKLNESRSVEIITPVFNPGYPSTFLELAEKNIQVSVIVTKKIKDLMANDYPAQYNEILKKGNVCMYQVEDGLSFSLAVTDTFLSISMMYNNGTFDFLSSIVSYDPSALKLGADIFDYYRSASTGVGHAGD